MTKTEMLAILETLTEDIYYSVKDNMVRVTVDDFEGFDDDWHEIMREYANAERVEEFLDMLDEYPHEGDFYVVYHFEDFDLQLGFTSFDI